MEKYLKKLKRQLVRLQKQKAEYEEKYSGNETKYTFHGGQNIGYVQGQISTIENTIDELVDLLEDQ